jgi:hypothetical protein
MSGGWFPLSAAPRDGTPVVLWMAQDDDLPVLPLIVGFWTISSSASVGYWRIFGDPPRFCSDRQIRGSLPLVWARTLSGLSRAEEAAHRANALRLIIPPSHTV